ncbi:copper-binding protein [Stutzerimonas stutzeri]|uniref:Copper-binding protein n=1 Tax=Stutzerimonas stutzeri TaxID=316 RepID=A0A2S4AQQ1_STUST|nr:copper-binding protein [Stutzerimonas stutzeri]MCQ4262179.1 copper-binding protein [Stutzerimonas stutzeri]POH83729.1 copper-binding protein [Stutzerimonas stutzeri]
MKIVFLALLVGFWLSGNAAAEDLLKPSTTPPPIDEVSADNGLEAEPAYEAEGVIRGIDVQQGSVTIAHGPVPRLKWPAMVMPFKVNAAQLNGLAVGDAVEFRFTDGEMDPQIVFIRRQ